MLTMRDFVNFTADYGSEWTKWIFRRAFDAGKGGVVPEFGDKNHNRSEAEMGELAFEA